VGLHHHQHTVCGPRPLIHLAQARSFRRSDAARGPHRSRADGAEALGDSSADTLLVGTWRVTTTPCHSQMVGTGSKLGRTWSRPRRPENLGRTRIKYCEDEKHFPWRCDAAVGARSQRYARSDPACTLRNRLVTASAQTQTLESVAADLCVTTRTLRWHCTTPRTSSELE
jgi:hypothetical protein